MDGAARQRVDPVDPGREPVDGDGVLRDDESNGSHAQAQRVGYLRRDEHSPEHGSEKTALDQASSQPRTDADRLGVRRQEGGRSARSSGQEGGRSVRR